MDQSSIPFGLLFEESILEPPPDDIRVVYDPIDGLSYAKGTDGQCIPYVQLAWQQLITTRTGTFTKAEGDTEDNDND